MREIVLFIRGYSSIYCEIDDEMVFFIFDYYLINDDYEYFKQSEVDRIKYLMFFIKMNEVEKGGYLFLKFKIL